MLIEEREVFCPPLLISFSPILLFSLRHHLSLLFSSSFTLALPFSILPVFPPLPFYLSIWTLAGQTLFSIYISTLVSHILIFFPPPSTTILHRVFYATCKGKKTTRTE